MPSHELLLDFQSDLVVTRRWAVSGIHYARTLEAWLERLDANADAALEVLGGVYGPRRASRALGQWRLFLLSTAETWAWRGGGEWMVSHYLLEPRGAGEPLTPRSQASRAAVAAG
jgi:cyclopropane-fatty-acyl-phospholipid synthase